MHRNAGDSGQGVCSAHGLRLSSCSSGKMPCQCCDHSECHQHSDSGRQDQSAPLTRLPAARTLAGMSAKWLHQSHRAFLHRCCCKQLKRRQQQARQRPRPYVKRVQSLASDSSHKGFSIFQSAEFTDKQLRRQSQMLLGPGHQSQGSGAVSALTC